MKREKLTELRVGFFVFVGGLVALLTIFFIGGGKSIFKSTYELKAQFASTSGLRSGAVVQLSGVRVGEVKTIDFSPNLEDHSVTVSLEISEEFQSRIRTDSVASISTQGLLGDKFISVTLGSEQNPVLQDGDFLQSIAETDFDEMMKKAHATIENMSEVTAALRKLFTNEPGQEKGDMIAVIASLKDIMAEVEKGDGAAHALIYDEAGKKAVQDLAGTLKSLREVSEDMEKGEGTIGKLLQDPALYYDLRSVMGRVNRNKLFRTVVRESVEQNDKQVLK